MRAYLVSNVAEGAEKPGRRDDAEEATDVHDAFGASRVFRSEHAAGEDELYWKEPRPVGDEQWWNHCRGMGNDFDYHFWNDECLLDLNA